MKKFFLLLTFIILCSTLNVSAIEKSTEITFIYINGSNNLSYKNRDKFRIDFLDSVKKLHPEIKRKFENDELIKEIFLQNGKYKINPEPITFYLG